MIKLKRYYAYVALDQINYFEEKLKEREDKIKNIRRGEIVSSEDGTLCLSYVIEAEEGTIDHKWELPEEEL